MFVDEEAALVYAREVLGHPLLEPSCAVRSVTVVDHAVCVEFHWERNPNIWGMRFPLPRDGHDPVWTRWDPSSLREWVTHAIGVTLDEELQTGLLLRADVDIRDNVGWLKVPGPDAGGSRYCIGLPEDPVSAFLALRAQGVDAGTTIRASMNKDVEVVWFVATSTPQQQEPYLGQIAIHARVSGTTASVCSFDIIERGGSSPELAHDLLRVATRAVANLGVTTVIALPGSGDLEAFGFHPVPGGAAAGAVQPVNSVTLGEVRVNHVPDDTIPDGVVAYSTVLR